MSTAIKIPEVAGRPLACRPLVPPGVEESFLEVLGHRMRYLHCGQGEPLVLISGYLGFSFSFTENLDALGSSFRVYAPDLLNNGYSARTPRCCSLEQNAEQLAAFLDALGLPAAHFIASSYGGSSLMTLAATRPDRVRKLVAVSPPSPFSETGRWNIRLFQSPFGTIAGKIVAFAPAFLRRWMLGRVYADPGRARPGTMEQYLKPTRIPGTIEHLLDGVRRWEEDFAMLGRLLPRLASKPMLLLWGEQDRVVSLESGRCLLRALPASELAVIKDAGHLPYEEQPEDFNRTVMQYLAS